MKHSMVWHVGTIAAAWGAGYLMGLHYGFDPVKAATVGLVAEVASFTVGMIIEAVG